MLLFFISEVLWIEIIVFAWYFKSNIVINTNNYYSYTILLI